MLLIVSLIGILAILLLVGKKNRTLIIKKLFILNLLNYLIYIFFSYYNWPLFLNSILFFDGLLGLDRGILLNEILLIISSILLLNITPLYNESIINKNIKSIIEGEIYLILLGGLIGMILMINSKDWIITILSLQLVNLAIYFLLSVNKNSEKTLSGGFKYLLLSALASTLILLGIAYIYYFTGSTHYDNIFILNNYLDTKLLLPFLLILTGIFFKLGCAPFHQWLPDLYDCLPFNLVLWIAILPKITLLAFLLNIIPLLSYFKFNYILNIILIIALISLIIGNIGMGYQFRIKRFIAYSSISHIGFLLLALSHLDLNNYYIYYWIYMFTTINIFIILITILKGPTLISTKSLQSTHTHIHTEQQQQQQQQQHIQLQEQTNNKDLIYLNQLKGLFLINKPLGIALGINFLSLAGIPPLAGFFAKALIFISLIELSDWTSAIIAIITSTIGTAYYLKVYKICNLDVTSTNSFTNSQTYISYTIVPNVFISHLISLITILLILFIIKPYFLLSIIANSIF